MPPRTPASLSIATLSLALACTDPGSASPDETTAASSTGATASPSEGSEGHDTPAVPEPTTSLGTTSEAGTDSTGSTEPDPYGAQCEADVQDCPEGFKCLLRRDERAWEFVCLPVLGEGEAGDACTHDGVTNGTDSCDEDTWCIGSFDTTGRPWSGVCYPLCVSDMCEAPDDVCVGIGMLPVCAPACDPLVTGSCGSAESCILRGYEEGFVCFPSGADPHGQGEPCETGISCEPGLHCAQNVAGCAGGDYCCTALCDAADPMDACADAGAEAECVTIGVLTPGQEQVGACVVP